MSNDSSGGSSASRPYRKVARARQEAETRRRITEAAVELHGTVGPANTTITDVAKLAGVSRMTVYNHFPTDIDLFRACSSHWAEVHPFPDPSGWAAIDDPAERLLHGLAKLYAWYEANRGMLEGVLRDVPILPALAEVMGELWTTWAGGVIRTLAAGWRSPNAEGEAVEMALTVATDFHTWRLLADADSDPPTAAAIASRLVTGGFRASRRPASGTRSA